MNLPEVFVIGAPRCGTTTVYHALRDHPQVFMCPVKEPRTLAYPDGPPDVDDPHRMEDVPDQAAYMRLFDDAEPDQLRGDASTNYLSSQAARERIAKDRPDARIIVILRDPAERAYSNFMQHVRDGQETTDDFAEALAQEPERLAAGWSPYFGYRRMSMYHDDLAAWKAAFPDMLVVLYDDLKQAPRATMKAIFEHIGVTDHEPAVARHNASGVQREGGWAQRVLRSRSPLKRIYNAVLPERLRLRIWVAVRNRTLQRPDRPEAAIEALRRELDEDMRQTASLIGRDLSAWLAE